MAKNLIVRWSDPELILVATNLLEGHRLVLHAIYQAKLSNAKVLLVHVAPPSYLSDGTHEGLQLPRANSIPGSIKAKLDGMTGEFQLAGVECEPIVLNGLPEEQISQLVKSWSVDRVIISSRNATGVSRLVEGSVAEELIIGLDVPVCVIGRRTHPGAEWGTPLGRILCATSFQPGSALAARFASTLAELHHSQLVLLHVLDSTGMSEQEQELARFAAKQRLAALIPREARHRYQPVCLVREGNPASIIVGEAGSLPEDLIILGSPYPAMLPWLLGTSVVHRVVAESQCPVITIKPTAATDYLHDAADPEVTFAHPQVEVEATEPNR